MGEDYGAASALEMREWWIYSTIEKTVGRREKKDEIVSGTKKLEYDREMKETVH